MWLQAVRFFDSLGRGAGAETHRYDGLAAATEQAPRKCTVPTKPDSGSAV